MNTLPLTSPALVVQADPAAQTVAINGTPVFRTGTVKTGVVGGCWPDLAYPNGWVPAPLVPALIGCARPDLRTAEGQRWQKLLDATPLNTPDTVKLAVR
ncbi:hypothetical protein ACINK0_18090 (plasmid) [Deinococcus sp. VB343]|uniref:Uncharacterized protein n=1 Tax=Deinococcus sp. VB142 TaxID=3112952 RepID=A0AAU6Q8M7_9DEIO